MCACQEAISVGRNKLAQFRQNPAETLPEPRKLVPAYKDASSPSMRNAM